jgi:hypothetical protein
MDVILAILLVTAINMGAADRALAHPAGKCGYHTDSRADGTKTAVPPQRLSAFFTEYKLHLPVQFIDINAIPVLCSKRH